MKLLLLSFAALLSLSPGALRAADARSARPNIVVLLADDWRFDTLSCAGNPIVKTPRLDQLASQGVRFRQACVTTSICGVSRASMLTGQWMSRHGNRAFDAFATPWNETYPGLLRESGYYVGHVGKWHCGKFPAERFDFARQYFGTHWIKQPNGTQIHVTAKNQQDALDFLHARPTDKPFCLTVAFFATHAEDGNPEQFSPQPQSSQIYEDAVIPVAKTATDAAFRRLPWFLANERNEGRVRWHWRFDAPDKYQRMMKNYYRLASEVDATCGAILDELKAQGTLDNTLVIFTGDNGYLHGEHGLADKWYPFQESIRVPLIIRDPRLPQERRGQTNDEFALNVDLAPTMLAAAGVAAPASMQGHDLAPLYLNPQKSAWRNEFFYEHAVIRNRDFIPASQALVRKDWKYFYWPDYGVEQLFDLRADPLEETDLAGNVAFADRLVEMRNRLHQLRTDAR